MSQTPAARYQRSFRGLIAALVLLVVLVGGWTLLRSLLLRGVNASQPTVDYRSVVPRARREADFALLAPPSLPAGWKATSVRFDTGADSHWHLGVLTDHDDYVGLEQGPSSVRSLVRAAVDGRAKPGSPVRIAGERWTSFTSTGGDQGLARHVGRTSTVVVGHGVSRAVLESYTASLR